MINTIQTHNLTLKALNICSYNIKIFKTNFKD